MSLRNFVAEDGKRANLTCIKPTAGGKFFVDDDSAPDFFRMLAASDWSRPRLNALNDGSQKDRDSTDKSLEFLADGVGTIKQVTWGNG